MERNAVPFFMFFWAYANRRLVSETAWKNADVGILRVYVVFFVLGLVKSNSTDLQNYDNWLPATPSMKATFSLVLCILCCVGR